MTLLALLIGQGGCHISFIRRLLSVSLLVLNKMRSNNGGKYCSNKFEKLCKKYGIVRQKTTPYTHQHNGVAERLNIYLMEKEMSMFNGA